MTGSPAQGPSAKSTGNRLAWKVDLFIILAMQGFGFVAGALFYGYAYANQTIYYWTIPGAVGGVGSLFAARTLRRRIP